MPGTFVAIIRCMKIFSIKRVLGLAVVGGAVAYARKHGGFKKSIQGLLAKKDEFLADKSGSSTPSYKATQPY